MSVFDEFLYGAKKCFDAAAEKTSDLFEASKIQLEKSQLTCEIKEEYEKLGKICYHMSESGVDQTEKMKASIVRIHALRDELAQLRENAKSDRVKVCTECGAENSPHFKYCSSCGSRLG